MTQPERSASCAIFNVWIAQIPPPTYHKLNALPRHLASLCPSCLTVCKPLQMFPAPGELSRQIRAVYQTHTASLCARRKIKEVTSADLIGILKRIKYVLLTPTFLISSPEADNFLGDHIINTTYKHHEVTPGFRCTQPNPWTT